jgi:hypothetical protein
MVDPSLPMEMITMEFALPSDPILVAYLEMMYFLAYDDSWVCKYRIVPNLVYH